MAAGEKQLEENLNFFVNKNISGPLVWLNDYTTALITWWNKQWYRKTSLSSPVFTDCSKAVLLLWILFCYLCFLFVMLSCLFIAVLWSPAGKGLTSWLSCMWCFLAFLSLSHVVSWVRCGTWLYQFRGPLVDRQNLKKPLIWLQSFKTFNLAEKPLITFILINKPLTFQDQFEHKK